MINVVQPLIGLALSLVVGGCIKGYFWTKNELITTNAKLDLITDNHLTHIQAAIEQVAETFPAAIEKQTEAIVQLVDHWEKELRENRQDIRDLRTDIVAKL